ncbi:hypothetical protein J3F84DRAFT_380442 [Trichoderma pleuroticola]
MKKPSVSWIIQPTFCTVHAPVCACTPIYSPLFLQLLVPAAPPSFKPSNEKASPSVARVSTKDPSAIHCISAGGWVIGLAATCSLAQLSSRAPMAQPSLEDAASLHVHADFMVNLDGWLMLKTIWPVSPLQVLIGTAQCVLVCAHATQFQMSPSGSILLASLPTHKCMHALTFSSLFFPRLISPSKLARIVKRVSRRAVRPETPPRQNKH